jgi:hypothetical protein
MRNDSRPRAGIRTATNRQQRPSNGQAHLVLPSHRFCHRRIFAPAATIAAQTNAMMSLVLPKWIGARRLRVMSMVVARINPHRLGFACTLKSALAVEVEGTSVCDEYLLVKTFVTNHEPTHEFHTNSAPLIIWKN